MEQEVKKVIAWVKEYVENSKAKGVVIGNSGGKDSAVVMAIAVNALGKENVLAVAMPCLSIDSDLEDAKLVADTFGVKMITTDNDHITNGLYYTTDLSKTYLELETEVQKSLNKEISTDSKINMKPRLRMTTLYSIAQTLGYLVIGTGNLCEATVGYTTKWGDSAYDFNPIANFTVEEVLEIGKILGVPEKIIKKAPNDGLGSGTDEEKMGVSYSQITEYINTGKTESKAMEIIKELNKKSEHKRNPSPVYLYRRSTICKE